MHKKTPKTHRLSRYKLLSLRFVLNFLSFFLILTLNDLKYTQGHKNYMHFYLEDNLLLSYIQYFFKILNLKTLECYKSSTMVPIDRKYTTFY